MLKLLIADDEYHIVNHLNRLLSRLDCCETDLLCAYSGPAAMDLILSSRIDVAFLDINMPKINGLQLASALHAQWPDCRIVFLTAYEVFDYIYEATQYPGAIYLLKAESDEKILDTARFCCLDILKKQETESILTAAQKKERLLLLLQEQQLLRELLSEGSVADPESYVRENSLDISLPLQKDCYLMLMHIKRGISSIRNASFYLEKMGQLLGNLFSFSFVEAEKNIFLWFFWEKEQTSDSASCAPSWFSCLKDVMDSFLTLCSHVCRQSVSLCLYPGKVSWKRFPLVYQQLYDYYFSEISLTRFGASVACVMDASETKSDLPVSAVSASQNFSPRPEYLREMNQALFLGNREQFLSCLHTCRQYCTATASMHNTACIRLYFSIVLIYLDYIGHYRLESQLAMHTALYPLYYISDFRGWDQAFRYLTNLAELLFRTASENSQDKARQLVHAIQNYIGEHLSEDLTLTRISDYVNYNESHVSRLFKKITASNLSDYIVSRRIELAKSLLVQTRDTIQVISQKTGFHTSQYFSSVFRKNVGLSPNEYRQKSQAQNTRAPQD